MNRSNPSKSNDYQEVSGKRCDRDKNIQGLINVD